MKRVTQNAINILNGLIVTATHNMRTADKESRANNHEWKYESNYWYNKGRLHGLLSVLHWINNKQKG